MNLLPLTPADFEPGVPLRQGLYDEGGHLLFRAGETLPAGYPLEGLFRAPEGYVGEVETPVEEFSAGDLQEDFPPEAMFPPEGIKPQMWEVVQLHMIGRTGQPYYFTRLVGYIRDTSILVTIPRIHRQFAALAEGELVEVRMLTGRNIYRFSSEIVKVCDRPAPYLHLSYPARVMRQHLRKAPWAKAEMPCSVENDGGMCGATLANLSATGACVNAATPLGVEGTTIKVIFHTEADGYHHDFSLLARIMKVRRGNRQPAMTEHGVEFLDVPENDELRLRCLVYQRIAEGFVV